MAGIDISKLSQGVQNFIEKNNIDVDGDGNVTKSDLAQALANVNVSEKVSGDSFSSQMLK